MTELSDDACVSVRLRNSNHEATLLRITSVNACIHEWTICADIDCVQSWGEDWHIYFYRTEGGRKLAAALGIDPNSDSIQEAASNRTSAAVGDTDKPVDN